MLVWRLASNRHPPLSGDGARLVGGRWNSPGQPVIYTSESLALCLAECLVHITGALPKDYQAVQLHLSDKDFTELPAKKLKPGWEDDLALSRAVGDEWLRNERTLALIVPSAILPDSKNVLVNPQHPRKKSIRIISQKPFTFDPRLRP